VEPDADTGPDLNEGHEILSLSHGVRVVVVLRHVLLADIFILGCHHLTIQYVSTGILFFVLQFNNFSFFLAVYGSYLVFQLQTHSSLYNGKDIPKSTTYPKKVPKEKKSRDGIFSSSAAHTVSDSVSAPSTGHDNTDEEAAREVDQVEEVPELSFVATVVLLVTVTGVRKTLFLC
jgi:hypothetical protein